jgi:hypothetical protein
VGPPGPPLRARGGSRCARSMVIVYLIRIECIYPGKMLCKACRIQRPVVSRLFPDASSMLLVLIWLRVLGGSSSILRSIKYLSSSHRDLWCRNPSAC